MLKTLGTVLLVDQTEFKLQNVNVLMDTMNHKNVPNVNHVHIGVKLVITPLNVMNVK